MGRTKDKSRYSDTASLLENTDEINDLEDNTRDKLIDVIGTLDDAKNIEDPDELEPIVLRVRKKYEGAFKDLERWQSWKNVRSDDELELTAKLVEGKKADLPIVFPKGSLEVTANGSCSKSAKLEAVRQYAIANETLKKEAKGSAKFTAALEAQAQAKIEVGEWAQIDASVQAFVGAVIEAKGTASISWEEVLLEASVSFFAGLKVNADASVQLGSAENNVKIAGSLEGTAGIEATANVKFGLSKDG
ncbi:MAG: hypothetical protein P8J33_17600, partial [Pirellulaceae bacterium]|nr:hypothetical protein [Pirellulaceae bacterium]